MAARTILRGADSIKFLASHGVTFTLPYGQSKDAMPKGWNRPGAGVGADEAIAHYQQKNNVGALAEHVVTIDIDFDFPEKVEGLGSLADTAKVWRDNAKERGALLYKLVDGPVQSADWKPAGATEPHAELKAQTKTGNYAQKNVVGRYNGGEYCVVDAQLGIKQITCADLALIWLLITGEELHAPKPAKTHTAKPIERKPVNEHDDLVAQVKAYWLPLAVFERHGWVKNGTQNDGGGEIRVLGHGGLLIKPNGLWFNHSDQVGGDAIDAWAICTRRDRDHYFVDIIEEMADTAGIDVPRPSYLPEPALLPEGTQVLDNGTVILKTTPMAEPKPQAKLPPCTPTISWALVQTLNSPEGRKILSDLTARSREVYVAALSVLLTIAPKRGGWVYDISTATLGEMLGKSRMSASRNLHALDAKGKLNYRHGAVQTQVGDAPPMRVDLSPIIYQLLDVTGVNDAENVTRLTIPTSCNVYERFAGGGEFADATMRANPMIKGLHGRTLRNVNASTLNALDLVSRGELAFTRRQLADELGMSMGSVAGATRICVELRIATVEKVGRTNEYVFSPDWREQLEAAVPKMVSFLASYRLKIRNLSDLIVEVERQIKQLGADPNRDPNRWPKTNVQDDESPEVTDLRTRRKRMLFVRQKLINEMEAKDLAHRPQDAPTHAPGQWVGTPPYRDAPSGKRSAPNRVSEGELIERRLSVFAAARERKAVAA